MKSGFELVPLDEKDLNCIKRMQNKVNHVILQLIENSRQKILDFNVSEDDLIIFNLK